MCKVSVIMPAYHAEKFIEKSIQSVVNQTYQEWELIIVNDGSTDGTRNIILTYAMRYPSQIKLIDHEYNKGTANALNTALSHATGEYICWLSADDEYEQEFIQTSLEFLDDNLQFEGCFCRYKRIDETGQLIGEWRSSNYVNELLEENSRQPYYRLITESNAFNGCCYFGNRKTFQETGWFSTSYRYAHDYDYWLRLCSRFSIGFLDLALVKSREYQGQITKLGRNEVDAIRVFFEFIEKRPDAAFKLLKKAGIADLQSGIGICFEKRIQKYALNQPELDELFHRTENYIKNELMQFQLQDIQWKMLKKELELINQKVTFPSEKIWEPYGAQGFLAGICSVNNLSGMVLNKKAIRFEEYQSLSSRERFLKGLERDNEIFWIEIATEKYEEWIEDSNYKFLMGSGEILSIGFSEYLRYLPEWKERLSGFEIHKAEFTVWQSLVRYILGEKSETIY